jgi:hypothetical protein
MFLHMNRCVVPSMAANLQSMLKRLSGRRGSDHSIASDRGPTPRHLEPEC